MRERESFVVACIIFINMKIFVCLIKQACLFAAHTHGLCGIRQCIYVAELISCIFLFENVCLSYKTSLLACNHFQIWGGG
jgi:hypothetical protein